MKKLISLIVVSLLSNCGPRTDPSLDAMKKWGDCMSDNYFRQRQTMSDAVSTRIDLIIGNCRDYKVEYTKALIANGDGWAALAKADTLEQHLRQSMVEHLYQDEIDVLKRRTQQ